MKRKKRPKTGKPAGGRAEGPGPLASGTEVTVTRCNVLKEVSYICGLASAAEPRVVGLGQLLFFSTSARDAWVLGWEDDLALCLMLAGDLQLHEILESEQRFAIRWPGHYQIEGETFMYFDNLDQARSRLFTGYPVKHILTTIEQLRRSLGGT